MRVTPRVALWSVGLMALLCMASPPARAEGEQVSRAPPSASSAGIVDWRLERREVDPDDPVGSISRAVIARLGLGPRARLAPGKGSELNGYSIVPVQQYEAGLPVVGRDGVVGIAPDGTGFVLGRFQSVGALSVTPRRSPADLPRRGDGPGTDAPPRLVYRATADGRVRLAWEVREPQWSAGGPPALAYFDAETGELVDELPRLHTTAPREVIDYASVCRALGIVSPGPEGSLAYVAAVASGPRRREGDAPSGVSAVDGAYDMLGEARRFLREALQIDGLDGAGGPLRAVTRIRFLPGTAEPQCVGGALNAFWDSSRGVMGLTEQAALSPEIVGHELAHGVISFGRDLEYSFESGALNEAFADFVGVAFRAWSLQGGRFPAATRPEHWELRGSGRSLRRPGALGLPDHLDVFRRLPYALDYGGVHINSSVMNQALYLLAEGGSHPRLGGTAVTGIGLARTTRIVGEAVRHTLSSQSTFAMARPALAQAAERLYGRDSVEWQAVHEAMDAIGVPGSWTRVAPAPRPAPAPTPSPTPAPAPGGHDAGSLDLNWAVPLMFVALLAALLLALKAADRSRHPAAAAAPAVAAPVLRQAGSQAPSPSVQGTWMLQSFDGSEAIPLSDALLGERDGVVIGRAAELVHVSMESLQVSRRHVRLFRDGGELWCEDLGSAHGTELEGIRLQPFTPHALRSGQFLRIAGFSYCLRPA
jgi:neutral peptidase B